MTRFVVRPTGPSESDGYSVVDTNREDERGKQIGPPDASWREFVGLIVGVARAAIARATGKQEASR